MLDTIADNVDTALLNVSHSEHKTLATLYLLPPRSKFQATVKQMIHRVWRFKTATVPHCHFQHANFLYSSSRSMSSDVDGLIVLKIPSRNNPTTETVKAEARAPPKHTHDRTWLKSLPQESVHPVTRTVYDCDMQTEGHVLAAAPCEANVIVKYLEHEHTFPVKTKVLVTSIS